MYIITAHVARFIRRRRGRNLVKNELILYQRNSQLSRSVQYAQEIMILVRQGLQERAQVKFARQGFVPHGNMKHLDIVVISLSGLRRTWSFHVVTLQKTAKKCTNIYNARAQPLFFLIKPFVWWGSRCRCHVKQFLVVNI